MNMDGHVYIYSQQLQIDRETHLFLELQIPQATERKWDFFPSDCLGKHIARIAVQIKAEVLKI